MWVTYLPLPGANVHGAAPNSAGEETPGGETTLAAVRAAHGALLVQVTQGKGFGNPY